MNYLPNKWILCLILVIIGFADSQAAVALTGVYLAPNDISLSSGCSVQLKAYSLDGDGKSVAVSVGIRWSANSAAGTINTDGVFIATGLPGNYASAVTASFNDGSTASTAVEIINARGSGGYTFERSWSTSYGSDLDGYPRNGNFQIPCDVAVGSNGLVYVADTLNCRIQVFDTNGSFVDSWGEADNLYLAFPLSIAVDNLGNVFSGWNKFDSSGNFLFNYAITDRPALPPAEWYYDLGGGQAVGPGGQVYISSNVILQFDAEGTFVRQWGQFGSSAGEFQQPAGMAVDNSGNVYVADTYNYRVQKFNADGVFIGKFGSYGTADSQFLYPTDVAVGDNGDIYVVDAIANKVKVFNSEFTFKCNIVGDTTTSAQFSYPSGIGFDQNGNIYVADSGHDQIMKFIPTPLSVTINQASGQADPTGASPINFTVVFSETVSDFATGDVALSGTAGATTATVTGSGTTYNVAVSGMTASGIVIVSLASGVAHDAAGNSNTASTSTDNTVQYEIFAPTVTGITPDIGVNTGSVNITNLVGTGFLSGATVKLTKSGQSDITATSVVILSSSSITCAIDITGKATGAWNVVVTNPDTQSGVLSNGFTLNLPEPTVTGITPNNAPNVGSTKITELVGSRFELGATVKLTKSGESDIVATEVIVVGLSKITCMFDLAGKAPGEWNVVITNANGQFGTLASGFTIILDPPASGVRFWNLDTNPGWSTDGQWAFGQPTGSGGTAHGKPDPNSGYTGSNVFGVNLSGDYSTAVGGPYYLTTGAINCSSLQTVRLKFMRWLNSDSESFVKKTVEISSDGYHWTTVWHNSSSEIADSTWVLCDYDITAFAAYESTVYIRWGYQISTGAYAYSGWNIDDVQVTEKNNDWWMFGHDPQHTFRSPFVGPSVPAQKWEFTLGDLVSSSPAIGSDGTIYVGSNKIDKASGDYDLGSLYAINPDGSKKWVFATGGYVHSSPAIGSDGTIYVGSNDSNLYAINPDGSKKWEFATGGDVRSSPAIGSDGTIYVGSSEYDFGVGSLYAINPDGSKKWVFATGGYVNSSPAIGSDGTIYVGSYDGNLYAINPDGSRKWDFATGGDVRSSPAIGSDGTIYVGSCYNNLYAINPDGSKKWEVATRVEESSPAIGSDGTIYVGSWDGNLYAINPDGSYKWQFATGNYVYSSPAIGSDGTIYVGSFGSNLYAINPDGSNKWAFATGNYVYSSPAIGSDGTIYVGSYYGKLYAIGPGAQGPSVSINQAAGQSDPAYSLQINFTVVFSEEVSDFATGDVALSGTAAATTVTVTGSGTTYNVAVSGMTVSGTVIASLASGVAHDAAGNANTASSSTDNTVQYNKPDTTPPTVTINQASGQADPTGASPINFTVVFSETVSDFITGDVTFSGTAGATTGTVTGSGTTYNVAVSGMTTSGTVIASLTAGVAHDAAGNSNTVSTSTDKTVQYNKPDTTPPTVTINQASGQADPTGVLPINFTVVFSETVSDFATGDVTLSGTAGATTATVTGSGTTYNVAVSGMTTSGTVIASLASGVAHDAAGNANTVSTSTDKTVQYNKPDTTPPTVTINQASGQADPTGTSPINFTVVFSETVSDFATGDAALSGTAGATTGTVTGSGTTYNVAVSGMTASGTVIASLAAGVAHDAAGNSNTASSSTDKTVVYETSVTVNQAPGQIDPTSSSPINFTVVFNAPVTDFAAGDVTISGTAGGTKTATVTGSGKTYTVEVNGMTTSGTVWVSIPAGVAHNATGLANLASTSTDNKVTYDIGGPTIGRGDWWMFGHDPQHTFRSPFVGPSVPAQKWEFAMGNYVGHSSPAIGSDGTIYVGSGLYLYAINPDGSKKWDFVTGGYVFSSSAIGSDGTIYVGSEDKKLYAINPDGSKKWESATGDGVYSSPAIGSDGTIYVGSEDKKLYAINPDGSKKWESATGDGVYSSPAIGSDGTIYVGSHDNNLYAINPDGSKKWQFAVGIYESSPTIGADGTIYVGSGYNLYAINPDGSKKWQFTAGGPVNSSPAIGSDGTIFLGSNGWDEVSRGYIGHLYAINPDGSKKWQFATGNWVDYSPAIGSDGTIYVGSSYNLYAINPDGSKQWEFTLGNMVSSSPAIGSDGTIYVGSSYSLFAIVQGVSVSIDQALSQADPADTSPINFTAVFSGPVTDFADGDIILSGTAGATIASVSNTSGDNMTYTVAVSGMRRIGTVIATIPAGVARSVSGCGNDASTSTDNTVVYGTTVTVNQAAGQIDPTSSSPINFTVVFNAPVTDFAAGDVTISGTAGGTKTATITGSGKTYTVEVNGMTTSGTVWVSIPAGVAHNATGLANLASTSTDNNVKYDIGGPTIGRGDWWMFGHDPQHTFRSPFVGPSVPAKKWDFATGNAVNVSPAIGSDGTIYVGSFAGNIYAINPDSSQKWMFATGNWVISSPAIGTDGTIYVGSGYNLYAINPDGSKKWEFATGSGVYSSPAIGSDGTIYVGSNYYDEASGYYDLGVLYAINPDGSKKWEFATKWGVWSSPAIGSDGTMYVGSGYNLYAITPDGSKKWEFATGRVSSSPAIGSDGTIYVGSGSYLDAINPDGSKKWEFASGQLESSPAIGSDGTIYVGSNDDVSGAGNIYAINPDGSTKWMSATGNWVNSSPTIGFDGTIYVGSDKYDEVSGSFTSNLYAINPDGSQKWDFATGRFSGECSPAIGSDGTIYVGTNYYDETSGYYDLGVLYAIGLATVCPSVTIDQASGQADPTGASPINFTVVFSETVSDFATGDVTLSGTAGATTATVTGSGTTYNVAVSGMTTSGTVIASLVSDVAHDAAGNANTVSTSTDKTVQYNKPDTTPPTVTINQASGQADPTGVSPINFTVVFSETVTDFATGDVTLSGTAGATTATVTGSGTTYNVAVSGMTASGTVIASLAAGVAHDAAGNTNTASTSTDNTVQYNKPDTTPPTVTINQASSQADPTGVSPINFAVVFSETVSDFATGDVTLSGTAGATTATVTGSGTTYNVAVTGMTTSGTVIASLASGVAHDAAGNANLTSTSTDNTVQYNKPDTTPPTVTINQASGQADPTGVSPVNFTVVFSETVSDFATGDVTLSGTAGATTATVTGSGTTYNVAVSGMTVSGTVIASLAAGAAHDAAGNATAASTSTDNKVQYDNESPKIAITAPLADGICVRTGSIVLLKGTASDVTSSVTTVMWRNDSTGGSGSCAGTTVWEAQSLPLQFGENKVTVTATDNAGNRGSASITFNRIDVQADVSASWSGMAMITLPIVPDFIDPANVVAFDLPKWWWFNGEKNAYEYYMGLHIPSLCWFRDIGDPILATPGRGFWAKFPDGPVSVPSGTVPATVGHVDIRLKAGWNMIGNPFLEAVNWDLDGLLVRSADGVIEEPLGDSSLMMHAAFGWDVVEKNYYVVYDSSKLTGWPNDKLVPWQAYWVRALADCVLVIPSPRTLVTTHILDVRSSHETDLRSLADTINQAGSLPVPPPTLSR